MLAVTEIFSLLYCLFIPGLLIFPRFGIRAGLAGSLVLTVAISMLFNHVLVVLLTLCGLYTRLSVQLSVAVLLALLVVALVRDRFANPAAVEAPRPLRGIDALGLGAALILFGCAILAYGRVVWHDFGAIYYIWDDIVSWNRWALDWTAGRLPQMTWEYPQLLPSLWSLVYLLSGTSEIQFFPKAMMAWLPMLSLFCFVAIWREERRADGVIAGLVAAQILLRLSFWATAAYADFPTGILALISIYAGWLSTRRTGREADHAAWLGGALAGAAALTKQGGLFFALAYPVFLSLTTPAESRSWRRLCWGVVLTLGIAVPWYAYRAIRILDGSEQDMIAYTTQTIHGTRSYAERFLQSFGYIADGFAGSIWQWLPFSLPNWLQLPLSWLVVIGSAGALASRLGRLLLLLVVPYTLFYAFFLGYDLRNFLPILPILAWTVGVGLSSLGRIVAQVVIQIVTQVVSGIGWPRPAFLDRRLGTERAPGQSSRISLLACSGVFALLVAADTASWAGGWPSPEALQARQNAALQKVGVGRPGLNEALLDYVGSHGDTRLILTSYQLLRVIPGLKEHYLWSDFGSVAEFKALIDAQPVDLVVDIGLESPDLATELTAEQADGRLLCLASGQTWKVLKVVRASR